VILAVLASAPVFAQEDADDSPVEMHLNFFVGSVGMHIPIGAEGSMQLFNLGVELNSGLGFTFSPFNLFGWLGGRPTGKMAVTPQSKNSGLVFAMDGGANLINLSLYWNLGGLIFRPRNSETEGIFLAPFTEFNWLFFGYLGGIDAKRFRFFAGIKYGRYRGDKLKFTPFAVEMGACLDYNPWVWGGTTSGNTLDEFGNPVKEESTKSWLYNSIQDWKFVIRIKFGR